MQRISFASLPGLYYDGCFQPASCHWFVSLCNGGIQVDRSLLEKPMILDCLEKVLRHKDLTLEEASSVMEEILSGRGSPTQVAALLLALAMKGETEEELLGMARILHGQASPFNQYGPVEVGLADTGRRMLLPARPSREGVSSAVEPAPSFPIPAAVAFVVAGAGVRVLQHVCHARNSEGESAGVLETLGVNTRIPAWKIARSVAEIGLGFVFEPFGSEAMQHLLFADREIPVPTALHLVLPLLNPGGAPALALEVPAPQMTQTIARVATRMGVRRAFVFHGSDGLDEITNTGPTEMAEVLEGCIRFQRIEPGNFGIPAVRPEDLAGGDARRNADIILSVLQGEAGPRRNVILLNAAPGIVCGGKARDLAEGLRVAADSIASGKALRVLQHFAEFTQQAC